MSTYRVGLEILVKTYDIHKQDRACPRSWVSRALLGLALSCVLTGCYDPPVSESVEPIAPVITLAQMADEARYESVRRGAESIRRLTREQFVHAVQTLLGDEIVVPRIAEPDVARRGLRSMGASFLTYTPRAPTATQKEASRSARRLWHRSPVKEHP